MLTGKHVMKLWLYFLNSAGLVTKLHDPQDPGLKPSSCNRWPAATQIQLGQWNSAVRVSDLGCGLRGLRPYNGLNA